ncbi:MAG: hpcH/HpaI aldolase/citrate lyase family protein [Nocardioidaceae bacterium]|nr:hpcH/HpaI aldolase/citrate lyase family protein [Nocardioidaceae bacterium]
MTGSFAARLRAGEPTYMLGIRGARTTDVVRMARSTGHHALMIDLEHSAMSVQTAVDLCSAAADLGLWAFVRPSERDYGTIGRVLDGGASGVVVPRVETAEEARSVARACRFAPRGQRSQVASLPQLGMRPTPAAELNPQVDDATFVQVIVETPLGVANAEQIAAQDGVDMLVLGANDFTAELGEPGNYAHPAVRQAVVDLVAACRRHDKLVMVAGIGDRVVHRELAALGAAPLVLTGMDTDLLYGALRARVEALESSRAQALR